MDADNQVTTMDDSRFSGVQLQPVSFGDSLPGICATIDGVQWNFINTDENGYEYLNPAGKLVKFENPKVSNVFLDNAMSGRGHIWNKTIPVLGKHVLMGSGANSYMFEVPQADYISQNYMYSANSYDVKAHNWYLQQWVEIRITRYPGAPGISVLVPGTVGTHLSQSEFTREYQLGWIWIICSSAGIYVCRDCK